MSLAKIIEGETLTSLEAKTLMHNMTAGEISPEEMAAIVSVMRFRGEKQEEVAGFAECLLEKAKKVNVEMDCIDVCGTGGDGANTFNISTAVAFTLASLGVKVAKHGNRAVSSKCGSSDVLGALGIDIQLSEERIHRSLEQHNFAFFFAPLYHDAFKNIAGVRRKLRSRTVFNLLGPLVNPLRVKRQLIGLYDLKLIPLVANTLAQMGKTDAIVVASEDGLDEFSLSSKSHYAHLKNGNITFHTLEPEDVGLKRCSIDKVQGGDQETNANILVDIFKGKAGAPLDIVALNSAAGLMVAGKTESFAEGVALAKNELLSGRVMELVHKLRELSAC